MRSGLAKVEGDGWLKVVGLGGITNNAKRPMPLDEGGGNVDRWETSVKSREAEQSVLGNKLETQRISNCDKKKQRWETSAKACGQQRPEWTGRHTSLKSCGQRIESLVGNGWETGGRKARNHAAENPERSGRQLGGQVTKSQSVRETSGRLKLRGQRIQRVVGENWNE